MRALLIAILYIFTLSSCSSGGDESTSVVPPQADPNDLPQIGQIHQIADINTTPETGSMQPKGLMSFGGWLYFVGYGTQDIGLALWRTDGTQVTVVHDFDCESLRYSNYPQIVAGNYLYYAGCMNASGWELWRTDGATVEQVSEIGAGAISSLPSNFAVLDGWVYFQASNPLFGKELWRHKGTIIERVSDIHNGIGSSSPSNLTVHNGWLYFSADDGSNGVELWRTNGSAVELVHDIKPGTTSSYPEPLISAGNWIYFTAKDDAGRMRLWKSDGTTTEIVDNPAGLTSLTSPSTLTAFDGWLYVNVYSNSTFSEVWRTNGSVTELYSDIYSRTNQDYAAVIAQAGNFVYFSVKSAGSADLAELWRTDGTTTERITSVSTEFFDTVAWIKQVGNRTYFLEDYFFSSPPLYISQQRLWMTNGVEALRVGTEPSTLEFAMLENPVAIGDSLYVSALIGELRSEIFLIQDLTIQQITHLPSDQLTASSIESEAEPMHRLGEWLYFSADDGIYGAEIWRTDGSVAERVTDINPGADGSSPTDLTAWNGWIYFTATAEGDSINFYRANGTTTELVAPVRPTLQYGPASPYVELDEWLYFSSKQKVVAPPGSIPVDPNTETDSILTRTNGIDTEFIDSISFVHSIVRMGDWLYINGQNASGANAILRTNGATAESILVSNGLGNSDIVAANGWVYFEVSSNGNREIHRTDGVSVELVSGPNSTLRAVIDDWVYYTVYDRMTGELWRSKGDVNVAVPGTSKPAQYVYRGTTLVIPWSLNVVGRLGEWTYLAIDTEAHGWELWRMNLDGIEFFADISEGPTSGSPGPAVEYQGWLYFRAVSDTHSSELWRTDGNTVQRISNINTNGSSRAYNLTLLEDKIVFFANNGITGLEPWVLELSQQTSE